MKKEFKLWLSVNDGEYFSVIKVKAEKVEVLEREETEEGYVFPVKVDNAVLFFDELVEVEEG